MTNEGARAPAGEGTGQSGADVGVSGVLADLADVHAALANATTNADILTAVARGVARYSPASMELCYVYCDDAGSPAETEIKAAWAAGAILPQHPLLNVRMSATQWSTTPFWARAPQEIFHIEDVNTDPRVDDGFRALMADLGKSSVAVLSLWSRETQRWHGMITLTWAEPHALTTEERVVYTMLAQVVSAIVAGRQAIAGYQEALEEARVLYEASGLLHAATTSEEALRAVAGRAVDDEGAVCAILASVEVNGEGAPEWFNVVSVIGPSEGAKQFAGGRFDLSKHPFARRWIEDPGGFQMVSDIDRDERMDARSRGMYASMGARSALTLPLLVRMRWVGLIVIMWPAPRELSEGERRLYGSLAKKAAMVVENRLLTEKIQAALADSSRQRVALKTILENLPVGVFVSEAGTNRVLLRNRVAGDLLGLPEKISEGWSEASVKPLRPGTDAPLPLKEWPMVQVVLTGATARGELDIARRDGSRVSLEVLSVPLRDEKGDLASVVSLFQDIGERQRAEQERLQMKEDLIRAQAAALAERGSPLIPISDDIVVMPLIGSIDEERGRQVLEALLHGVSQARARFAIIDVTGARVIDASAAGTLTGAAKALRLLGVEPVLTGIRADIAQTLVGLGVDLAGIRTLGTLQSGIAYATGKMAAAGGY